MVNWKIPAGVAAILVVSLLLVPLVNDLSGGIRSAAEDFKNQNEQDRLRKDTPGGILDPELGGISGSNRGNYVSKPANPNAQWSPDRDGESGNLVCDFVFSPDPGCMKRLVGLDAVKSNYNLYVANPILTRESVGDGISPLNTQRFEGRFSIRLEAGKYTPVFSVAPDADIASYATTPFVGNVEFYKDGADTFYARAASSATVDLAITYYARPSYFVLNIPATLSISSMPPQLVPSFPPELRAAAARVAGEIGVAGERNLAAAVTKMRDYFSAFGEGEIPGEKVEPDSYLAIALGKNGCCRHRAFAFLVTAQSM
ncbi:MAG TPA: hypothetical protein VI565_00995, partial [Burkholderiales bacterium]|nr:hypothetical protein [Burkholderiales bacterium]